jgi:WhiB family redox-sensing transcriptional regulator
MSKLPCATIPLSEADKLFFSESEKRQAKAIALCNSCPAISGCLDFALENEIEFGIYGGTTPKQRQKLLTNKVK